jgi:hypothetical protein
MIILEKACYRALAEQSQRSSAAGGQYSRKWHTCGLLLEQFRLVTATSRCLAVTYDLEREEILLPTNLLTQT